jgi:hypothetical protein
MVIGRQCRFCVRYEVYPHIRLTKNRTSATKATQRFVSLFSPALNDYNSLKALIGSAQEADKSLDFVGRAFNIFDKIG